VLAEGIEVCGANLDNGLLHIDLERPLPEPVVRQIKIERNGDKDRTSRTIDVSPDQD